MTDWKQITCAEREALIDERGRSHNGFSTESGVGVISGRTDLGGFPPIIETVWGEADETPVLKDVRHPARHDFPDDEPAPDLKPCEHWVPEAATDTKVTDEAFAALWKSLTEAELRHYGYTDEQIALANKVPPHTSDCTFEAMDWDCTDEHGKSFHPEADEADLVAGIIGRALEAAQPFMSAAPVASRERVAEVLADEVRTWPMDAGLPHHPDDAKSVLTFRRLADALLAAGVFRQPPTQEQIATAVGGHDTRQRYDGPVMTWYCTCAAWSSTSPHQAVLDQANHISDLVLAAIGGDPA